MEKVINSLKKYNLGFNNCEAGIGFVNSLPDEHRRFIELYLPPMAEINELVDSEGYGPEYQKRIQNIIRKAWHGRENRSFSNQHEAAVDCCIKYLREMHSKGNDLAELTFDSLIELQNAEYRNALRRWKLLSNEELEDILYPIGVCDIQIILSATIPEIGRDGILDVSKSLGWALRKADTLSDFYSDMRRGYINIPKENIGVVKGIKIQEDKVTEVSSDLEIELPYLENELKQTLLEFEESSITIKRLSSRLPENALKRLQLAEEWAGYFLLEAKKTVNKANACK